MKTANKPAWRWLSGLSRRYGHKDRGSDPQHPYESHAGTAVHIWKLRAETEGAGGGWNMWRQKYPKGSA